MYACISLHDASSCCVVHAARYRKLLETAKDVDNFTRFVIEKYAELYHNLHLNHYQDDEVEAAEWRKSSCDHDFLSRHEMMLTDCPQQQADDIYGTSIVSHHRCSFYHRFVIIIIIIIIIIIVIINKHPIAYSRPVFFGRRV